MKDDLKRSMQLSRALPPIQSMRYIARRIARKALKGQKENQVLQVDVLGFKMELETAEFVDRGLLFSPQLTELPQRAFLKTVLGPGDIFLDLGANIGFYSLFAAPLVGESGRVLSIEADPYTFAKLEKNIALNSFTNITPLSCGLSDSNELLSLKINNHGNRGANSFISMKKETEETVSVQCHPLHEVLHTQGVNRVKAAKIDVEGFESRILAPY